MDHTLRAAKRPVHHRVAAFLVEEFRLLLPPTLFFAVGFNLILLSQRILVPDYLLRFADSMVATLTALVVGKAVLLANLVPFFRRYDNEPLIKPILHKTMVYWVCVFVVRLLEAYVHYIINEERLDGFLTYMLDNFVWRRFVFIQLWILVLFLIYTAGTELNNLFGDGELFRILFRHRSSDVKQTRRQRIRTLTHLSRLADTTPIATISDPTSKAHARLLELLRQLSGSPRLRRGSPG